MRWPRLGTAVAVIAAAVAASAALAALQPYAEGRMLAAHVREVAAAEEGREAGGSVDWDALRAINPATVAWVSVPGTAIDYPVVQAGADDPEHWLHHAFDGTPGKVGTVYSDPEGLDSPTPCLFGHSLLDGSMFSDFARYADEGYALEHDRIEVLAPSGNARLRVIGVAVVPGDATRRTGVTGGAALADFYAESLSRCSAVFDAPERVDRLWTFVTCADAAGKYRILVLACDDPEGNTV